MKLSGLGVVEMMRHVSSRKRMGILLPALVALLGLLFWLSGCASQKELSGLQRQIWANHGQLEKNKTEVVQLEKSMGLQTLPVAMKPAQPSSKV